MQKEKTYSTPPWKNRPHPTMSTLPWYLEISNPTRFEVIGKFSYSSLELGEGVPTRSLDHLVAQKAEDRCCLEHSPYNWITYIFRGIRENMPTTRKHNFTPERAPLTASVLSDTGMSHRDDSRSEKVWFQTFFTLDIPVNVRVLPYSFQIIQIFQDFFSLTL